MERNRLCSVCLEKGIQSSLRLFQINFDEAVFLCENKNCHDLFPSDLTTAFVRRHVSEITVMDSQKKKKSSKSKFRQEFVVTSAPLPELSTDSTPYSSSKDILQDFLESLENYNFNMKNQTEDTSTVARNDSLGCCLLDSLEECSSVGLSVVPGCSETMEPSLIYSRLTLEKDWEKKEEKGEVLYSATDGINTHLVTSQETCEHYGKSVMPNGDSTSISWTSKDANKMGLQLMSSVPNEEVSVTSFTSAELSKQNRTSWTGSCDSDLRSNDGHDETTALVKLEIDDKNLDEKDIFMGQDNTSSGNFTMQEDSQPGKDLLEECKEIQEVELKQSTDAGVLTQQEISKSKRFYPLWMNADNLCWLDAALSLIVHNTKLPYYFSRSSSSQRSVVETVYQSYQSAVDLLNSECGPDVRWNMGKEKFVSESMVSLQEEAFRCLKNKFRCDLGQEDSPVLALMLLLNEEEFLREAFLTNYFWEFKCERCGHHKVDRFQKTILTVPRVLSDFTVTNCYLLQPCLKCGAVDQRKHLQFESLSECIAVHFVDGLLTNSVSSYDFAHHNVQYKVKGVIQYKTNCSPKHFVTWIRNPTENTWLCCDDLQGSKVAFQQEDPQILASQMHVLVWEKEQSDTVVPGYLDQDKTLTQSSSCGSSVHLLQNAVSHPSLVQVPGSALPKETPFVSRSIGPDSTLTSAELQEGIESLAVCSKIQTTLVTSEKHSTLAPSMTDSCSECLKPPHLADLKDENITPVIEYNKLSCNPVFVTTTSVNMTSFVNSQVTSESNCQPAVMITSIVNSTFLTPSVQPTVMTTSSVNSTLLTSGVQPTVMTTSSVNSTLLTSGVQPTVMTTSSVNSTLLTSGVQPTVMTKYMNSRIRPSDVQSEVITRMTANPTLLVTGIQPTVMTPTMSSTPLTQSTVNHILLTSGVQSSVITKSNQNPSILVSGVQPTVVTQSAVNPKLLKSGVYPTVMTQSAANCILVTTGVHPSIMTSAVRPTLVTSGVQPIVMTTSMNPTLLTSGGESKVMTQSTVNPTLLLSGVQPLIITSTVSPTLLPSGVQPTVITTSVNCTTAVSNVQSMTIPTSTLNPTVMNTASAESTCMTSCVTHMAMSELSSLVPVGRDAENYATDFTHDLAVSSTDNGRKQTAIYIMTRDDDKEPKLHLLTTVPADTSSAKALLESTGIVSSSESVSPQYSSDVNYGRISQELEACHADRFVSTRSQSFLQNRLLKRKKTAKRMVNTRPAQKRNSHNTEYFNNPKISLEFDENVVPLGDNIKPCKTKKLQKVSEGSQKKVKQLEQLEVTRKENILAAQSVPSSVAEYVGLSGSIPSPSDRSIASEGEASLLSSSGIFDCGSTDVSSSESGSKKTSLSKQFFVKQIKTLVKEKCRSSGYEGYKPKLTPVRTNPTSRKRKMNSTASFNEEPDEVSPKFLKSTEIAQDEGSYLVNKINQKSVWSDNIITELFG